MFPRGRPIGPRVTRVLAVADEVDRALTGDALRQLRPDLILSAGDLPFDYLETLVTRAGVPLLYVPGNHDPDLRPDQPITVMPSAADPLPGPQGCDSVDGRVAEVASLRVAGLGGSIRYKPGPNQYTQRQMRWRALSLEARVKLRWGPRAGVDVLLAHAPPRGVGDEEDPAHRGFEALLGLAARLRPALLVHGHVHPVQRQAPERTLGITRVVNAIPSRLLEL